MDAVMAEFLGRCEGGRKPARPPRSGSGRQQRLDTLAGVSRRLPGGACNYASLPAPSGSAAGVRPLRHLLREDAEKARLLAPLGLGVLLLRGCPRQGGLFAAIQAGLLLI